MNVNSSDMNSRVYNLIKKSLDASALRNKVSANNIANINTKGYKAFSVSFEDTLKQEANSLAMKATDERHIKSVEGSGEISVKQDNSSSMREDGNNVNIDSEMANQAANTLMYNAMITQLNNKLSNERYIISGGGR